ncbi:acetolactate synthase small subunit [Microbacterium sp. APC 3898]|jgi:acetolactate synthase-1/3 small subunit|uniref:Acetolactate synthase small subunit n=2 Tax=Planococcus TaxID=1372 RepID=A0ABT7ZPE6_9BACL|nr:MULTISPECIES: acetolactate synthase small subunit [Terrabacteria group]MBF6634187.1 acetolactate synthase small subunit [Planococcus sp. (in: firmicutes)]MBD8016695.1 acetolactate synthase small subunit [Planococcus wigleyi]MDN3429051.1 acetolactate synthase small subunit [Planococcus sp. APC 4016]MDN3439830.1 acetolactate synthase small subunit [Planococcus sp. APC 3900]MDN3500798.1 acetolactate synthase small subunit [Microbacterium sp. APC 3898]
MKRVITTTVINQSGVLNRVTGLLMKRQFNIESISVGHTEQPGMSKMTFVVNVEDKGKLEQLLKQLQKQIDVIKVNDITDKAMVMRELALVKVVVPPAVRNEVLSIVEPFRATVVDMSKNVTTFQVTGDPEKIEAFIDLMRPYGVKELTRTGVSAFVRETQKAQTPQLNIL